VLGKIANKSYGVVDDHFLFVRKSKSARCRIERRKHFLLGVDFGLSERIEQRRLACIRVTDKRNQRKIFLCTSLTSLLPLTAEVIDLTFKLRDPISHTSTVGFQFCFTRTASADPPASLENCGVLTTTSRGRRYLAAPARLAAYLPATVHVERKYRGSTADDR
jgi:hypothetical protein